MKRTHHSKEILTFLLDKHKLSPKELAQATGVAAANISRIKNDENSNPTLSTLMPIAKFFNITVSELIGESQPSTDNSSKALELKIKSAMKSFIDDFSFEELNNI